MQSDSRKLNICGIFPETLWFPHSFIGQVFDFALLWFLELCSFMFISIKSVIFGGNDHLCYFPKTSEFHAFLLWSINVCVNKSSRCAGPLMLHSSTFRSWRERRLFCVLVRCWDTFLSRTNGTLWVAALIKVIVFFWKGKSRSSSSCSRLSATNTFSFLNF